MTEFSTTDAESPPHTVSPWPVSIVGENPVAVHLAERLGLAPQFQVLEELNNASNVLAGSASRGVIFTGHVATSIVVQAIRQGQRVALAEPQRFSSKDLDEFHRVAADAGGIVTGVCLRRWSPDYLLAQRARSSGRLGQLQMILQSVCEQTIPDGDPRDAFRDRCFRHFDHLLALADSDPVTVTGWLFAPPADGSITSETGPQPHGFLAIVEFENGCHARIELLTETRLSFRTGWMLEGAAGSYRGERLLVTTTDGEIVDEPIEPWLEAGDPLVEGLLLAWNEQATPLPSVATLARTMRLLEGFAQSAETGEKVSLASAGLER